MIFAPPRTRGAAIAAAFAGAGIVLGVVLLLRGYSAHVSFAAFLNYTLGVVLLVAGLVLGYWAYAAATLRYQLSGGALSIRWGFVEHVIPLSAVERIVLGRHLPAPAASGFRLPGVAVGEAYISKVGRATLYLRYRGPEDILYLVMPSGAVGLSLTEVQPFVRALQQAQRESASHPVAGGIRRGALARLGFFADRRAVLLSAVALLLTWLSAAVVYSRYQRRATSVTLHFPSTEAAHLGSRSSLLQIPEAAMAWFVVAVVLAVLLFSRARVASYLLLAGAAFSGALFLIAAIGATG
ncbi:MAG: PH domain-containing protein [Dehalococcoidia bacterium]